MPGLTILVVDDSRMSRMLIAAIAADVYPDARIIQANGGKQALQESEQTQIDIATLDFNMPDMDGISLAKLLRERFPQARLGIISAHLEDEIQEQLDGLGIAFIPKPISEESVGGFLRSPR